VARQRDLERVEARLDRLETKVDAMSTRIIGSMLAFGTVQTAVIGLIVSLD
jgi:tetrahydromethanopterin S-methyltransferase subunit G